MATASTASTPSPWHAAYPTPRNSPATISREEVLDMIKRSAETPSRDYVLIDLRRTDYEVELTTTLQVPSRRANRARAALFAIRSTFPRRACTLPCPPYIRFLKTQASAK